MTGGFIFGLTATLQYSIWNNDILWLVGISCFIIFFTPIFSLRTNARSVALTYSIFLLIGCFALVFNLTTILIGEVATRVAGHLMVMFVIFSCVSRAGLGRDGGAAFNKTYAFGRGVATGYAAASAIMLLHFAVYYYADHDLFPESRSAAHSVSVSDSVRLRATGYYREPSFAVPFIVDSMILAGIFFKTKGWVAIVCCIASMAGVISGSPAFYLSMPILAFTVLLTNARRRHLLTSLRLMTGVVITLAVLPSDYLSAIFDYVGHRVAGMAAGDGARLEVASKLVSEYVTDLSGFKLLFGYGVGSFQFLGADGVLMSDGSRLHSSPNNGLLHIAYNFGVIGLCVYVVFLWQVLVVRHSSSRIYLVFLASIILASMYRSDFVSLRYAIFLALTGAYIRISMANKNDYNN